MGSTPFQSRIISYSKELFGLSNAFIMKSLENDYSPDTDTSSWLIGIEDGGSGFPKQWRFSEITSLIGFKIILIYTTGHGSTWSKLSY